MTAIALVSEINHLDNNKVNLFWDTIYMNKQDLALNSVEMSPFWLKHINSVLCALTWSPKPMEIKPNR